MLCQFLHLLGSYRSRYSADLTLSGFILVAMVTRYCSCMPKWNDGVKLMSVKRTSDTLWLQRFKFVSLSLTKPFSPYKILF